MKQCNYFIGTVGTDVRYGQTKEGKPWASFRMAVNHEFLNRETQNFETVDTVWFEVSAFGVLANNIRASVFLGDSVFVVGRLKTRDWESDDGKQGTTVQILAEAAGLNLQFSQAVSTKRLDKARQTTSTAESSTDAGSETGEDELQSTGPHSDPFAHTAAPGLAHGNAERSFATQGAPF